MDFATQVERWAGEQAHAAPETRRALDAMKSLHRDCFFFAARVTETFQNRTSETTVWSLDTKRGAEETLRAILEWRTSLAAASPKEAPLKEAET